MEPLIKLSSDIEPVLLLIKEQPSSGDPIHSMDHQINFIRHEALRTAKQKQFNWANWFLSMGHCAWKLILASPYPFSEPDFYHLLLKKHKLYSAEPLVRWGALGIAIRLDSKLERYKNLFILKETLGKTLHKEREETIQDTMTDMLGYCILGYIAVTKENLK